MTRLDKLTSDRARAFHRIGSLYVELSTMPAESPEYVEHLREIASLKAEVTKLQRRIVVARMRKVEKYMSL